MGHSLAFPTSGIFHLELKKACNICEELAIVQRNEFLCSGANCYCKRLYRPGCCAEGLRIRSTTFSGPCEAVAGRAEPCNETLGALSFLSVSKYNCFALQGV